jgi:serine/threonine protein kinase
MHRLSHVALMSVQALFESLDGRFYLQMPYYPRTLRIWAAQTASSEPSATHELELRAVLLRLCQGVAHLHAHHVVHCTQGAQTRARALVLCRAEARSNVLCAADIKPTNVLMNSDGWPVLADFDVSIDNEGRTQRPFVTTTARKQHPNLRSSKQHASAPADVLVAAVLLRPRWRPLRRARAATSRPRCATARPPPSSRTPSPSV